jgi:peroxiredoxin
MQRTLVLGILALSASACSSQASDKPAGPSSAPTIAAESATARAHVGGGAHAAGVAPGAATADIGKPAPDFDLTDLDGKHVKLSDYKGKIVVLEWFNPGCPFVKAAHTKGSLRDTAKRATAEGVVWLAINSGGPGKQGNGVDANREGAKTFGLTHPILLDESGKVGAAYGATNTPNMFVIDTNGVLAYAGAIDNSPDGEGDSPTGGKLVNYVDQALVELAAKKPVSTPRTQPYGCSVKYGSKS